MQTMTLAATKAQLSALVDQVEKGEEVVITRRGRPVARIVAVAAHPQPDTRWIDDLAAFVNARTLASSNSVAAMRAQETY